MKLKHYKNIYSILDFIKYKISTGIVVVFILLFALLQMFSSINIFIVTLSIISVVLLLCCVSVKIFLIKDLNCKITYLSDFYYTISNNNGMYDEYEHLRGKELFIFKYKKNGIMELVSFDGEIHLVNKCKIKSIEDRTVTLYPKPIFNIGDSVQIIGIEILTDSFIVETKQKFVYSIPYQCINDYERILDKYKDY